MAMLATEAETTNTASGPLKRLNPGNHVTICGLIGMNERTAFKSGYEPPREAVVVRPTVVIVKRRPDAYDEDKLFATGSLLLPVSKLMSAIDAEATETAITLAVSLMV